MPTTGDGDTELRQRKQQQQEGAADDTHSEQQQQQQQAQEDAKKPCRPTPPPLILPLQQQQYGATLYLVLVFFVSTAVMIQHSMPTFYGMQSIHHGLHRVLGYRSALWAFYYSLATAAYTTYQAYNLNAFRHALFRCLVNIALPIVLVYGMPPLLPFSALDTLWLATGGTCVQYMIDGSSQLRLDVKSWWRCQQLAGGSTVGGFMPSMLIFLCTHAVLTMREEHMVWLRRLLNKKRDAVAAGRARGIAPADVNNIEADDEDKDWIDLLLFWGSFVFGMALSFNIIVASLYFGSAAEKITGAVLGYLSWWLTYVQWYPRWTVKWRPALPGNYHIYTDANFVQVPPTGGAQ
ncbi:hypothetical protein RI367_002150 [Sorochytrium milnesiophthora]